MDEQSIQIPTEYLQCATKSKGSVENSIEYTQMEKAVRGDEKMWISEKSHWQWLSGRLQNIISISEAVRPQCYRRIGSAR